VINTGYGFSSFITFYRNCSISWFGKSSFKDRHLWKSGFKVDEWSLTTSSIDFGHSGYERQISLLLSYFLINGNSCGVVVVLINIAIASLVCSMSMCWEENWTGILPIWKAWMCRLTHNRSTLTSMLILLLTSFY